MVFSPWCVECADREAKTDVDHALVRRAEMLLAANGVPLSMREWRISTFPHNDTPARHAAYIAARSWLAAYRDGNRSNLFLHGPIGVGKTWLAVSMCNKLCEEGTAAYFVLWRDLLSDLRAAFREKQKEESEGYDALERARGCAVLILDDLGAERPTEWAMEELAGLVQRRLNTSAPIVVTSNLSPEALLRYLGNDLTAGRIVDRLLDHATVHQIEGMSRRKRP